MTVLGVVLFLISGGVWARMVRKSRPTQVNARMISGVVFVTWLVSALTVAVLYWTLGGHFHVG